MSYARWSNSSWYAFYNVNGKLSLWYDMDTTIDLPYDEVSHMLTMEEKIPEFLKEVYKCTEEEAIEAIQYMKYYVEDYDPKDSEEYNKELSEMLKKWESEDGQEKNTVED
jgi:hypothetical protein